MQRSIQQPAELVVQSWMRGKDQVVAMNSSRRESKVSAIDASFVVEGAPPCVLTAVHIYLTSICISLLTLVRVIMLFSNFFPRAAPSKKRFSMQSVV